jgi:hypothetical protein
VRKCEKVTPNLCVKKSGKKSVRKIQKQLNKKNTFFSRSSAFLQPPGSTMSGSALASLTGVIDCALTTTKSSEMSSFLADFRNVLGN